MSGEENRSWICVNFPHAGSSTWLGGEYIKVTFPYLELQAELACQDERRTLTQFIDLAFQIDNLIRSRRSNWNMSSIAFTTPSTPIELAYASIYASTVVRRNIWERHAQQDLLLATLRRWVRLYIQSLQSKSCLKVPVVLAVKGRRVATSALINSGAAGHFISHEFVQLHRVPVTACNSFLAVEALNEDHSEMAKSIMSPWISNW